MIDKFLGSNEEKATNKALGDLAPYVKMYQKLMNMGGMQTRMPFELVIR